MEKSNIALCGFMASGKTTVGALLAGMIGFEFVDTDSLIEQRAGRTISEIFRDEGEAAFREIEREVIAVEVNRGSLVLAVGGGAVLDDRNVRELGKACSIYHLDVTPEEVMARTCGTEGRPLLGDERDDISQLLESREDAYREAADLTVDTVGREPEDVALEIAADFDRRKEAG